MAGFCVRAVTTTAAGAPSVSHDQSLPGPGRQPLKLTISSFGFPIVMAACLARYALVAGRVLQANRAWLSTSVPDDAFYYLEIAHRMSVGQGATFDGINPTNGFHPMWQGILAAAGVFWSGTDLLRVSLLLELGAFVVASVIASLLVHPRISCMNIVYWFMSLTLVVKNVERGSFGVDCR